MTWISSDVAMLGTALIAAYGIDAWAREHRGKRRTELAEDVLVLFYEVQDVVRAVRSPISFGAETEHVEQNEHEAENAYRARKNASIVFARLFKHSEVLSKLHAMRYRFMAQIGKEEAKPFNDLQDLIGELRIASSALSRMWARDNFVDDIQRELHFNEVQKHESVIWEGLLDTDPIQPRLDEIIFEIEKTCQRVINYPTTIFGFFNMHIGLKMFRGRTKKARI